MTVSMNELELNELADLITTRLDANVDPQTEQAQTVQLTPEQYDAIVSLQIGILFAIGLLLGFLSLKFAFTR